MTLCDWLLALEGSAQEITTLVQSITCPILGVDGIRRIKCEKSFFFHCILFYLLSND